MTIRCSQCGARMLHAHRTFWERFRYLAIYKCRECDVETAVPRPYTYHLGPHCQCPRCGTLRLVRLKKPYQTASRQAGFLNLLERLAAGKLTHCHPCFLQFYDRRALAPQAAAVKKPEIQNTFRT